jgi:hypothetical protein
MSTIEKKSITVANPANDRLLSKGSPVRRELKLMNPVDVKQVMKTIAARHVPAENHTYRPWVPS